MSTPSSPPVLLSPTPTASFHSAEGSAPGEPIDGFAVGSGGASAGGAGAAAGASPAPRVRGSPGIPLTAGGPFPPFAGSGRSGESGGSGGKGARTAMAGSPPLSPALTSPSSPLPSPAGAIGGGDGPAPPPSTAVTAERKRTLLLEARRDRLAWVDGAAAPFRRTDHGTSPFGDGMEAIDLLGSSRACETLQSAFDVVAALYGTSLQDDAEGWSGGLSRAEAMERMRQQLERSISEEDRKKIASAISLGRAEEGYSDGSPTSAEDDEFIAEYRKFVERLKMPECADLVQGMKHFGLTLRNMVDAAVAGKKVCRENDVQEIASAIHGHINETLEKIRSHALWAKENAGIDEKEASTDVNGKDDDKSMQSTKQVLEAFVFAINQTTIWSIMSSIGTTDEVVDSKLTALQFVTPSHLDIHHLLVGKDGEEEDLSNGTGDDAYEEPRPWDSALKAPILSLRSIGYQHSPGRMLSGILGAYKGVVDALSNAKVIDAGADDLLPTLILSVLRAKPTGMTSSLKFVELFATPEQLRGEAGYAFTNLFGAVQFIQDLDFDDHGSSNGHDGGSGSVDLKVKGLTITPEEFRRGLEKCAAGFKEKRESAEAKVESAKQEDETTTDVFDDEDDGLFDIPPSVVREARLSGETIDANWADRWLERHRAEVSKERAEKAESGEYMDDRGSVPKPPPLPPGFTRSYTFLSTKPEDIRMSDIPQLLREYRMLVHASETLLAERTAKYNAEHKLHVRRMRDRMKQDAVNDY